MTINHTLNVSLIVERIFEVSNHPIDVINIFSEPTQNEADGIIFFKPEICSMDSSQLSKVLNYFKFMLESFSIYIQSAYIISGLFLTKYNIINQIYNKIRNNALLEVNKNKSSHIPLTNVLNELQFCTKAQGSLVLTEQGYTADYLYALWQKDKSAITVAEDLYVIPCYLNNEWILLINGFYPYILEQYKSSKSKIILFTFNTRENFEILKTYFQGKAEILNRQKNSIRQFLFDHKDELGLNELSVSSNGIHLSKNRKEGLTEAHVFMNAFNQHLNERIH